jgi:hypothetical protein
MRALTPATHLLVALAITAAGVAIAFALPVPAHATTVIVPDGGDADAVVGSGQAVDVRRVVAAFTALHVDGPLEVEARPGPSPGVVVHADDNIAPLVESVVDGSKLVVRLKRGANIRTDTPIKVQVEFTQLAATRQHSNAELRVSGLEAARFESELSGSAALKLADARLGSFRASISGSGAVSVDGRAEDAHFAIKGSGELRAEHLVARKVDVSVSGSGDAHVNATEALHAHVAGFGDVRFRGHPHHVTRKVAGSGSIEAED